MAKSPDAFRTISEVAEWLDVPTHVLRFWESRFSQVKPVKRAGGRRYYRPSDMELLGGIKRLLHDDGLTIRGVQKLLREEGVKHVAGLSPGLDGRPAPTGGPDNVVALSSKKDDPDAALSRWPFVDDTPVADTPPIEEDTAPADATASPEEDPAEPEETPEKIESLVADVVPEEPVPSEKTVPEAAETERDDVAPEAVPAETERPPFAQPPLFDESNVYFAGPLPVAGLARLSPRHALRHADALEHALERGRDLARSMDRVDG